MQHRVVITGVGVVAPGGIGREAFWETLSSGQSGCGVTPLGDLERFRSRVAAAVFDWEPRQQGFSDQEQHALDRHIQFALVAAAEAWNDAGLTTPAIEAELLGVVAGTAIGSSSLLEREYVTLSQNATEYNVDVTRAPAFLADAFNPSFLSAKVAAHLGARGPVATISSGCTAGLDAIAQGFEWISGGDANVVVAGGAEAGICPINIAAFDVIRATSLRNEHPQAASRPFDNARDGFVLGEGCAFLIMEQYEHALVRNAHIYGEITGYGSALNGYHMTALQREGLDMAQAIRQALTMAELAPEDVQYINAHGSSTKQNDLHETNAFKAIWGQRAYQIPISSLKSMVGHSLGAIGAIELAACALMLEHATLLPTINYHAPDPECDLDYIPNQARPCAIDTLVSTASGFGGFQSAMVMRKATNDHV